MRYHIFAFALVLAGLVLSGCATAPAPDKPSTVLPPAPASATTAKGDPNKLVCQTYTATGSRVQTSQQCFTAEEKAKMDEETRRAMRDMENTPARPQTSPMDPAGH